MDYTFTADLGPWWPWLFLFIGGFVASEPWRWVGVAFAGRLREDMEVFRLVRAIATALVAGVIAQLVFMPTGSIATIPPAVRLAALAVGFAASFAAPRAPLFVGVAVGEAVLFGGWFWFG
jgi:Branched-chain amino acid transport protein (AzlD)